MTVKPLQEVSKHDIKYHYLLVERVTYFSILLASDSFKGKVSVGVNTPAF